MKVKNTYSFDFDDNSVSISAKHRAYDEIYDEIDRLYQNKPMSWTKTAKINAKVQRTIKNESRSC